MALRPCRECGHEVSTAAKFCTSCGTPHPANKAAAVAEALDSGGKALQGCGCLLTLFVTVPIILAVMLLL